MTQDSLNESNAALAMLNSRISRMEVNSTGSVDKTTASEDADKQHNEEFRKTQRHIQDYIKRLTDERDSDRKENDRQKRDIVALQAKLNENGTQLLRAEADLRSIRDKEEQPRSLLEASSAGVSATKDTAWDTSQQIPHFKRQIAQGDQEISRKSSSNARLFVCFQEITDKL